MRLVLTSDTHYGLSGFNFLADLAAESPDVVVHAGDWATSRQEEFRYSMEMFRRSLSCPILSVRGNHDFWSLDRPPICSLYEQHKSWFAEYGIFDLSEGVFNYDGWSLTGFDGWYGQSEVYTNDPNYLTEWTEGLSTMEWFSRKAYVDLVRCVRRVGGVSEKRICVSHFPSFSEDHKYYKYCANAHYLDILKDSFDIVLYGHSHRRCDFLYGDSLRVVNAGSDYGKPRYVVLDL